MVNPFRFFLDPADTEVHRATWESLTPEQRARPILSAETLLAERHPDGGWSATMYDKTCWNPKANKYACRDRSDYLHPKSHKVRVSLRNLADAPTVDCTWLTAPQGRGGRGDTATMPCDTPVQLDIPYPGGAWIKVEIGGRQVAEVMARVSDVLIVGMGDSFAAGEGNPDVPVRFSPTRSMDYETGGGKGGLRGYPARMGPWRSIGDREFIEENARWQDQACHRSLYSHQLRVALQLAVEDPHRAVTFVGVACSGAEIISGLFLRYKGHEWVPSPPELSQISAVADAQCGGRARDQELPEAYHMQGRIPELKGGLVLRRCDADVARKIDLLLLSIGGNDIGFARLVANAVLADGSMLRTLGGWFGQVYGFADAGKHLDMLDDRYKAVNRAVHYLLHIPWDEADRVILTGYPPMALLDDGSTACPSGNDGMTVLPDFFLSEAKAREGNITAERLHGTMEDAARQHGWTFADAHRPAFRGRGICTGYTDKALDPGRRDAPAAPGGRGMDALQPVAMARLCAAAPMVPHAQRRVPDGQLPRLGVAAAEGAEVAEARLDAAAAGERLLGRLPSHRPGPGRDRRRRAGEGARRPRQVRGDATAGRCGRPEAGAIGRSRTGVLRRPCRARTGSLTMSAMLTIADVACGRHPRWPLRVDIDLTDVQL